MFKNEQTGWFADDPLAMCKNIHASREDCMGSSNPPETFKSGRRSISEAQLVRQMSEVISLREKVAQAELAAHLYGRTPEQNDEKSPPEK
jgi:hypothetical protein